MRAGLWNIYVYSGVISPPIMGGKRIFGDYFPPIMRDPGGKNSCYFPPIFETLGGKSRVPPPLWGEKSPPQAENFEDLEIQNAKFPLQKRILVSQILKKFRLRRAIFMCVFLYKVYFRDWNPKKFPPAAGYCLTKLNCFARHCFANGRSIFCAS